MVNLLGKSTKFITILLCITWVCFVFYIYLVNNVVFTPKVSIYLFLSAYVFIVRAFGEKIFEILSVKAERYPSVPKIILDLAMGIGVLSLMVYASALVIGNVRLSVLICLVLMFLLSLGNINKTFLRLLIIENRVNLLDLKRREIAIFLLLALLFLTVLVLSHTPAVDNAILQGDLSYSKQWLLTDTIIQDYPAVPLGTAYYLPFLYFFPDQTIDISILNSLIILIIAVMFYFVVFSQGANSRIKSLLGTLMFMSAPLILYLGTVPGIRPLNLLYFISAIYVIQKLQHSWDNKAQYITGIFLIFITNTLSLGIIYSFLILLYLVLSRLKCSKVFIFFLFSIALYLAVFLKFWMLLSVDMQDIFRVVNFSNIFSLFLFPIEISLFNKFASNHLPIGPILLILLPFMIFYYGKFFKRMRVIILILIFILISLFVNLNFRDFLPFYLYVSLLAAEVVFRIYRSSRFVSFFMIVFMIAVSAINMLNLLQYYFTEYEPVKVIFGLERFDSYLGSRLEDYRKYPSLENYIKKGDVLIINGKFNHFYLNVPYLSMDINHPDAGQIMEELSRRKIIYIALRHRKELPWPHEFIADLEGITLYRYQKND